MDHPEWDAQFAETEEERSERQRTKRLAQLRYRRPPGECAYCDAHRNDSMMPSHTASDRCESGKRNHCTCDTCF